MTRFLMLNGSSMATGVVSGLVAAMLEANNYGGYLRWQSLPVYRRSYFYTGAPTLTSNAVKAMLQYSATPLRDGNGVKYDALTQGSGEVNGYGALALAGSADTTKAAGSFWMSMQWPTETSFGGVTEQWSRDADLGHALRSRQQPGRHQPDRLGEEHRLGHRRDGQHRVGHVLAR